MTKVLPARPSLETEQTHSLKQKPDELENFVMRLQRLIAQIFQQLSTISELDSEKTAKIQRAFEDHTRTSADFTRKTGDAAPWVAAVGLAILLATGSDAVGKEIQELGKFASSQVSPIASMFTADWQAKSSLHGNQASMSLQEYTEKTNKKQADGSSREDYKRLMKEVQDSLMAASRSNG